MTRRALAAQEGPVVLVGHSYGGAVITEAGNDPKVAALVYVAAFAPDAGESVSTLIANPPPGAPVPPILPPQDGFLFLDRAQFPASFAADVSPDLAAFMADAQVPWGVGALGGAVSAPAWRSKPSWYLVATEDRMIPPPAQRAMATRTGATVVEAAGSHAIYVSQPAAVASLIEQAAGRGARGRALSPAPDAPPRPRYGPVGRRATIVVRRRARRVARGQGAQAAVVAVRTRAGAGGAGRAGSPALAPPALSGGAHGRGGGQAGQRPMISTRALSAGQAWRAAASAGRP